VTIETPDAPGSAQPNLHVHGDRLYLTWIEGADDTAAVRFAHMQGDDWSPARTIAESPALLANWADFPSLTVLDDGSLLAHWLVRTEGSFSYDIAVAASRDEGRTWSEPITPHRDGTLTEHGFVNLVPRPDGTAEAIWLDGRDFAEGGSKKMRLMSSVWDGGGFGPEVVVDDDVCTCCNLATVETTDGLLVAYRDHEPGEIRDISLARGTSAGWTTLGGLHADGWTIPACPVNGPALAERDGRIAVAWFTAAAGKGRVQQAFLDADGRVLSEVRVLDDASPVGRADVVLLADGSAVVSWLGRRDGGGEVRIRRVRPDGTVEPGRVVGRADPGRGTGFPRLGLIEDRLYIVWTEGAEPGGLKLVRADLAGS
jgi:hypothetical protein